MHESVQPMGGYRYYYTEGEANFGRPLRTQVKRGTHLTLEVVIHKQRTVFGLRRPAGLHDAPKNALYFPHGLIRFGESVDDCVARLVREQAGVGIKGTRLYYMDSWVDDEQHWHLALNVLAEIDREPRASREVSEIVRVTQSTIPDEFPWWKPKDLRALFDGWI